MDIEALSNAIQQGGAIGVLVFVIMGIIRKWLVPGWAHEELRDDRNFWRNAALRGTAAADEAVTLAGRVMGRETDDGRA